MNPITNFFQLAFKYGGNLAAVAGTGNFLNFCAWKIAGNAGPDPHYFVKPDPDPNYFGKDPDPHHPQNS